MLIKIKINKRGMLLGTVVHAFDASTWGGGARETDFCEFWASQCSK